MNTSNVTPPRYDDLPDLVTPEDARALLQVSKGTIYELPRTKKLPSLRFGRQLRIPKNALIWGDGLSGDLAIVSFPAYVGTEDVAVAMRSWQAFSNPTPCHRVDWLRKRPEV